MALAVVYRQVSNALRQHPILRGMLTYSVLWPSSNISQQFLEGREEINLSEAARFSLFGCFYVAPTLFTWVKISSYLFPGQSIKIAIKKVLVEQFTYGPFAITSFYMGMSLFEGKTWDDSIIELKRKFIPTFKTGMLFWPAVQTINFRFIKEKNRVPFTSFASFFWTVFLSYQKRI